MIIDWASFGIGVGCIIIPTIAFMITRKIFKRKQKYDLNVLRNLIYETGMKNKEVYDNIKELETVFKDLEGKK